MRSRLVRMLGGLLLLATPLGAAVIEVAAGDATGLQSAMTAADDGDVVELAGGTYMSPSGGFMIVDPNKRFTIRSASGAGAVLDGAGANPVLRYQVSNDSLAGEVIFQDLTFRDGLSTQDGVMGGVTVNRGNALFERCNFENNVSDAPNTGGGGAGVFTGNGFFSECVFDGNTATNESGGLRIGADARVFIHNSQFLNNRVNLPGHRPSSTGGGIGIIDAFLYVTNTRFEGNEAGFAGGAIYALSLWADPVTVPNSEVWVGNCTFVDNKAEPDPAIVTPSSSEGGAMHGENQILFNVFNSRFVTNSADVGGAINTLRGQVVIDNSVFQGNQVVETGAGTGFGGSIAANSNDGPEDGADNRPVADVTVTNSFIQGRFGAVGTVAQAAGGINATGDQNRQYGLAGVSQMPSLADNRMPLTLDNVILADLDVTVTAGVTGSGIGGGMSTALTSLGMDNSMVLGCDAIDIGNIGGVGGGLRLVIEADVQISNTVLAGNTADRRGGGMFVQGIDLDIADSTMVHNEVATPNELFGAAIFAGPIDVFAGQPLPVDGTVASTLFSGNTGTVDIFDDDRNNGPINDIVYNNNTFFDTPSPGDVYWNALAGGATASELNSLVVNRSGAANTDKGLGNTQLTTSPVFGSVSHAPLEILGVTAAGDAAAETEAYAAFAWSGASATFDGSPVASNVGWQSVGSGIHTLAVGAQSFTTTVGSGPVPAATFTASPSVVAAGGSSTLSWSTTAGTFVTAELDIAGAVASSGSMVVMPNVSTTYYLFVMTEQGGVFRSVTVFVGEPDIFADGFESGNTSAWSSATP